MSGQNFQMFNMNSLAIVLSVSIYNYNRYTGVIPMFEGFEATKCMSKSILPKSVIYLDISYFVSKLFVYRKQINQWVGRVSFS